MTKQEIINELKEKNIKHDENALKSDLEALLPVQEKTEETNEEKVGEAPKKEATSNKEMVVNGKVIAFENTHKLRLAKTLVRKATGQEKPEDVFELYKKYKGNYQES